MKNWMNIDVDGYFYDAPEPFDFTVDEICEDAEMMFRSVEIKYAKRYITEKVMKHEPAVELLHLINQYDEPVLQRTCITRQEIKEPPDG